MEPQLENRVVELTAETMFIRVFPFPIHNLEGDILVRRACNKAEDLKVRLSLARRPGVRWGLCHIDQVGIEDVEFVPLHHLRRRVVEVVVSLIVLVPHETCVHTVEESRFTGTVLVRPQERLVFQWGLRKESYINCSFH